MPYAWPIAPRRACEMCDDTAAGTLRQRTLHAIHLRNHGVILDQPGRRAA